MSDMHKLIIGSSPENHPALAGGSSQEQHKLWLEDNRKVGA